MRISPWAAAEAQPDDTIMSPFAVWRKGDFFSVKTGREARCNQCPTTGTQKGSRRRHPQKFEKAHSPVLIDYRGLTVAEVTDLRNSARAGRGVRRAQNTMIRLAAQEAGITVLIRFLNGPTAVASA